MVRVVDSLRTHRTPDAHERNWLMQTVQQCVPPGQTPLVQPTDTGFAMPGKAAARSVHERQRYLLRLKARQEGTKAIYKIGAREILQTAQAMHNRFVDLNETRQAVLAERRACGWLHWRPNAQSGKLELAEEQPWTHPLTEGSSRMGPEFRKRRSSFVEAGVPLALTSTALKEGAPLETHADYSHATLLSRALTALFMVFLLA